MVDRRAFLSRAAGLTLASGGGLGLLSALGCAGSVSPPAPKPSVWNELARRLSGPLLRPGDRGFASYALPNNLRYAGVQPAGIALCQSARDVATCILWAREHGVALVARSGGHSYGGYSTTHGLMVDVRPMNDFSFDAATGIATFGGGARNKDVFARGRQAGVAITHGRCFNVGVAGLTLGGGLGFNMRSHGLTCDQLIATQIVTADGALHSLDASNDDRGLLWACRGAGGGNFGINTSFSFQTFEVGKLTAYDLIWKHRLDRVFPAIVAALESAPPTLGCKLSVELSSHAGSIERRIHLLGQLYGSPAELQDVLAPAYAVATPSSGFVKHTDYWDAQDLLSELGLPEYFDERSRFVDRSIAPAEVDGILRWIARWPGTVPSAAFKLFLTGGKMNAVPAAATAFVHRDSSWLASIAIVWEAHTAPGDLRRSRAWQNDFYDALTAFAGGGAYQNFIDPALADWKRAYYAANLERLQRIKHRVDPARVFRFAEAIP